MTQVELARKNKTSLLARQVARSEEVSPQVISQGLADGRIVIPANKYRKLKRPCAIGHGLSTKVNTNLGTSPYCQKLGYEVKKLKLALKTGTDTVMDLSTGGDLRKIRRALLKQCPVPFGTVPIYEAIVEATRQKKEMSKVAAREFIEIVQRQAKEGVDFMTIHCGLTLVALERLEKQGRITGIVSRGGAVLARWMQENRAENPFYEYFNDVLAIAHEYDITLSLGDGLRPGSVADATDRAQIQELIILGELCQRARRAGVQVMIEGPGHMPLDQIEANVLLEKKLCQDAPFYVLGPLVTDIAPGYDHITSAIGATIAAASGADFLCYVTPAEHLRLPSLDDVKEGIIAAKISAHAADLVKGVRSAWKWDKAMSQARKARNWKKRIDLALDREKPRKYRLASSAKIKDVCTMCGEYCSMKLSNGGL
jgi:phosphomethylpyrimidine synthase